MHLLDDVRLIESEVLVLPTASMFDCSITKLGGYKHNDFWNTVGQVLIASIY